MAYFVGMLGNLLPLPGGLGGVEGGMIGALVAFGAPLELARRRRARLPRISFWLPTIPGVIAYFHLRRTVGRWREQDARTRGRFTRARCYTLQSEVTAPRPRYAVPVGCPDIAA